MIKRALHNSLFQWKYCTKHVKRTFFVSCIKNSLTLNSFAQQKCLLNTNCLLYKKYLLGFHWRNRSNQLRCNHLVGISTCVKKVIVSSNLHNNNRNLSLKNGKEVTQESQDSNQNGKVLNLQTFCLSKRNLICVSGPDSVNFLQGLITNDMNLFETENKKALYAMILNVQVGFCFYYLYFFT